MRLDRARIDRRLGPEAPPAPLSVEGSIAVFHDPWGELAQRFDLGELDLPGNMAVIFAAAFRSRGAPLSRDTRVSCWQALKVFSRFLAQEGGVADVEDLTTELFGRYVLWLDAQQSRRRKPCSIGVRYNRFQHIKRLTEWVARRHPELMPERPTFPYNPFPGRHAVTSDARQLSPSQLKTILRACYEEIDAAWATFEEGRRLLARDEDDEAHPHGALLRQVHEAGGGVIVTRAHMEQHYRLGRTIGRHGGPEMLARYLHLTPDTLTPFFIAIAIQTAANVDALRLIDRDCIEPHPLIEHRAMVDWQKGRAGRTFKRAQRRSFDRRHPYAAPRLIEMVLAMTAPLAALAPPGESDRLFLMRRRSGVSVIQRTTLDAAMARFVARANARVNAWNAQHPTAPRENLPPFCPTMFRSSVAGEHYRASGGDIRVAQDVLNHRSAATTEGYIRGEQSRRLQRETIARLQTLMITWILDQPSSPGGAGAPAGPSTPAEAFGHRCRDPLNGSGERLCSHFGGCLSCPGLVVPIDAVHLARLLRAIDQLEAARAKLDPQRWALIYKPSYDILTVGILPDFPAALSVEARRIMATLPALPALE